jgi:2'-5' RNA ligase
VRVCLGEAIEGLRPVAEGIGWAATENLHVTVKFLGRVEGERLALVREALDRAVAGAEPFDIAVAGLGAFPAPIRPRVIWAGVTTGEALLVSLAERVHRELGAIGFVREARPFTAHVTLGRVRAPRRNPALAEALERAASTGYAAFRVDRLSLMRSDLSPRGARHTELSAHALH